MGTELFDPQAFKSGPAQGFASLNPNEESLSDGIGQSYGVIGYKGKVWTLRYQGERHLFTRPDDGTPAGYIDVVFLQQARVKSKSYYGKWDPASENAGERPICSSIDGVTPDVDVQSKQANACAVCPRNEWKTDANGRKSRECTDYKRVAVLLMPNQTKPMLGNALIEPVFLRVPPASLGNLAKLGDDMAKQGYHFSTYITRIMFDPAESHPKMVFRALQGLTNNEAPVVISLRGDTLCNRIIGMDQPQMRQIAHQPAQPTGLQEVLPPSITDPVGTAAAAGETLPSNLETLGSAQPAIMTTPAPNNDIGPVTLATPSAASPSSTEKPTECLFGGAISAPRPNPPATTVSDTGEPDESDAMLDARIANLMPKLVS